jgi:hypothetical protein
LNYGEIDFAQANHVPRRARDFAPRCHNVDVGRLADRQLRARRARPGIHYLDHYDSSGLDSVHQPVLRRITIGHSELHDFGDNQSNPAITR